MSSAAPTPALHHRRAGWAIATALVAVALTAPASRAQYTYSTLPNAPGADFTLAYGLNDRGDVVGYTGALVGDDYVYHGFVYASGGFTALDVPGEPFAAAVGINNGGRIIFQTDGSVPDLHSYLFSGGAFTQLAVPVPGIRRTAAYAINNSGQVAGNFRDPATNVVTGFLYSGGAFTTFLVPGSTRTFGYGLNDQGQVVGYYRDAAGVDHGYIYTNGAFSTFDAPGASGTVLSGINASGQLLGTYYDSDDAPNTFVYSAGVYTPIDVAGAAGFDVYGINNRGQVVGQYFTISDAGDFGAFSFVASPATVPEPGPLALTAAGLGGLVVARRRRTAWLRGHGFLPLTVSRASSPAAPLRCPSPR